METIEIFMIIMSALWLVTLGLMVYLAFIKKPESADIVDDSFINEIRLLEKNLRTELTDSLLKINEVVNKQLMSISDTSSQSITNFRLNVNEQLSTFQEKMTDKFTQEFKSLDKTFQDQLLKINEKVEDRLNKGFHDTNQTFIDIVKRVEVIDQAQKNIKELSEEMVSLQNILSNNQARGAYGEYQLNQLLYSVYGQNNQLYQTQYTIKDKDKSVRVDAVVFMPKPNEMIAIDSKFPYSSYAKLFDESSLSKAEEDQLISQFGREVKKHITDVANKYIMPPQTTDYALMFVPSDGILSLLHSKLQNVIEYARDKAVTIVSPTTIIPLLSSFKAFVIDYERSKHMEKINEALLKLGRDFKKFGGEWAKLNRAIQTVKNDSDKFDSRVERIHSKFESIEDVGIIDKKNEIQDHK
jgi:DNA recombination protein RmuC